MIGFSEQSRIYELISSKMNKGVFLWGAGVNGGWVLDFCKREKIKVRGYIDKRANDDSSFKDLPLITPQTYRKEFINYPVFITAKHNAKEIMIQNPDIPLMMSFDAYYCVKYISQLALLEFCDDESYRVMNQLGKYMLTSDRDYLLDITCRNQYFEIAPFFNTGCEVFVDLGAYVGDTVESFLFAHHGAFSHIYAFEPGEKQFESLNNRMNRLVDEWALNTEKITLINKGIWSKTSIRYMSETDHLLGMQTMERGSMPIEVVSVDDCLIDKNVSFIKSDIEGDEYEMLLGAEKTIRTCHPKLALSVYHKPDDLLRIYLLLKSYNNEYRFSLRNHSSLFMDTTLYCY